MEELALGDKQSTEISCAEVALVDGSNKRSPDLVADIPEAREVSRTTLGKGVPNSGAEAWPQPVLVFRVGLIVVVHVVGEVVLEDVERLVGQNVYALIASIR